MVVPTSGEAVVTDEKPETTVHNQVSGDVPGVVVQAGVVHGDIIVHYHADATTPAPAASVGDRASAVRDALDLMSGTARLRVGRQIPAQHNGIAGSRLALASGEEVLAIWYWSRWYLAPLRTPQGLVITSRGVHLLRKSLVTFVPYTAFKKVTFSVAESNKVICQGRIRMFAFAAKGPNLDVVAPRSDNPMPVGRMVTFLKQMSA